MIQEKMKLSVIVPVYNDSKCLEECLKSIFNSDYKDFEVIVVNDCSTDNSLDVAKKFSCKIVDLEKNNGVANARNKGADVASGEILVFFDSDIIINKNTLSKFAEVHKNPEVSVCQCQVEPKALSKGISPDLTALSWNYMIQQMGDYATHVSTMAFSIKKSVFEEVGQFNTSFKSSGGEEFEIGHTLRQYGYKIHSNQTFMVKHYFHGFKSRCKALYRRSFIYANLVFKRKFELDKGHGTLKEGFISFFSMLGFLMLLISITLFTFSVRFATITLLLFLLTIFLTVFLDKGMNLFIIKERGVFFFLKTIPISYVWYFLMGLGVTKAFLFNFINKILSLFKQIKFFFSKTPYVIFSATSLCNARCKHCFNWKKVSNPNVKEELSLEEIEKISKKLGYVKYLTYTGGEPVLKKEIVEITRLFYENNHVEILNLITNGFATNEIKTKVTKILRNYPDLTLQITFSIDGIGKQHDEIRNVDGGFDKLLLSINKIKELQKHHNNLRIMAVTTYSKYNQNNILEIIDYITENLKLEVFLNYIRGNPYYSEAKEVNLEIYEKAVKKIIEFNNKNAKKGIIHKLLRVINSLSYNLTIRTIKEKKRIIPCKVGTKLVEIGEDGTVFPCEMLNMTFGNIREHNYDINQVLNSDKTKQFFKFLHKNKCFCTWECAMKSNLVFSPLHYPIILKESIMDERGRNAEVIQEKKTSSY